MTKLSKDITSLLETMNSIQKHVAEIGFQWGQCFEKKSTKHTG